MSTETSMQELRRRFPHPFNNEILNAPLGGGHPNYEDLLDSLGKTLPQDMTDMTVIPMENGVLEKFPASDYRFLVHEDIVFAAYVSVGIVLRLPKTSCVQALASGAKQTHQGLKLGQEWIDITWMQDGEQKRLIQIAYEYAAELAKIPLPAMTIISCPKCEMSYLLGSICKHLGFEVMCIFSPPVSLVEGTNIFARRSEKSKQFLVYSMAYEAGQDIVMILPLPVASHDENVAIRFIALDSYPDFFDDMLSGFPELMTELYRSLSGEHGRSVSEPLKVYEVGDYNASFIPTLNDFDRLDAQFKLSKQVWDCLPKYKDYGFAVFKLKPSTRNQQLYMSATEDNPYADRWSRFPSPSRMKRPHPMAFEFVTRSPDKLFFPTIHIHDGEVHDTADFDHHLYYQGDGFSNVPAFTKAVSSEEVASEFVDVTKTMGLVDGQQRCHAIVMSGRFPNQDTIISTV